MSGSVYGYGSDCTSRLILTALEAVEMSKKTSKSHAKPKRPKTKLGFPIWTTANRPSWTAFAHASPSADTATRSTSCLFSGIALNLAYRSAR
jgi:hypothetical protein